jgi:hypothetical protein
MKRYIILEDELGDEGLEIHPKNAGGFETIKAAEDFIKAEIVDILKSSQINIDEVDEDYSGRYHIAEMVKSVQPIPNIKVSVTLREVKE